MGPARQAGDARSQSKDATLVRTARFAVGRAGNTKVSQIRTAERHHVGIADRKFDDTIQSSVRGVAAEPPSTMNGAPIATLCVEGASVGYANLRRHVGKNFLALKSSPDGVNTHKFGPRASARRRTALHLDSGKAIVQETRLLVLD